MLVIRHSKPGLVCAHRFVFSTVSHPGIQADQHIVYVLVVTDFSNPQAEALIPMYVWCLHARTSTHMRQIFPSRFVILPRDVDSHLGTAIRALFRNHRAGRAGILYLQDMAMWVHRTTHASAQDIDGSI
jgi:hypothetical protein